MGVMLGSDRCWKKRRARGGLALYFEWFEGEPTMFITRAAQSALSGNRGTAAIALPCAHLYADSVTGEPTGRLIEFAMKACHQIGLEPSRMNVRAIANAIVDGLPDLLDMPPEPTTLQVTGKADRPLGEMTVIQGGRTIAEAEIVH